MEKYDIIFLGGGFVSPAMTGMLHEFNCLTIEKEEKLGGHCRSVSKKGFTFDIGGPHILFSKNKNILDILKSSLGKNYQYKDRNAVINLHNMIDYPYENGISKAPPEIRAQFLKSIVEQRMNNNSEFTIKNLKDFFITNFGHFAYNEYFEPYNKKCFN